MSNTPPKMQETPSYAGDISAAEAWALLEAEPAAQLIDVRTIPELTFVGTADLGSLGKQSLFAELQSFPSMSPNPQFVPEAVAALERAGARRDSPVLCLCRSGARSRTAAMALTRAGFTRAYNVAGGLEGDLDEDRHRGRLGGWKAAGLPWRQT